MTDSSQDRIALIESLLLQTAQSQRMTQQQLEKMQQQLESTQQHLDELTLKVDANTVAIADLTRDFRESFEDVAQWFADMINRADQDRTFIRGLQVENRRILRELREQRRGES